MTWAEHRTNQSIKEKLDVTNVLWIIDNMRNWKRNLGDPKDWEEKYTMKITEIGRLAASREEL